MSVRLIKDLTSAWPSHDLGACWPWEHPGRVLHGPSLKDLPSWELSPEHACPYLPPNSMPTASTQPHWCFGLPVGSVCGGSRGRLQLSKGSGHQAGWMWSSGSILGSTWEEGAAHAVLHPCRDFSCMRSLEGWLLSVSWFGLWLFGCCFAKVLFWGQVSARQGSLLSSEQLAVLLWRDGAAILLTSNSP